MVEPSGGSICRDYLTVGEAAAFLGISPGHYAIGTRRDALNPRAIRRTDIASIGSKTWPPFCSQKMH